MNALTLCSTAIRQLDGLYSLNDLHKASGADRKHQPSNFMRLDTTVALIEEIKSSDLRIIPFKSTQGRNGGTYVCKVLVYAYAMWISPKFNLAVIRAFDALHGQPTPPPPAPTGRPVHPWFPLVQQYLHQRLHAVPPAERRRVAVLTDDLVRGIGLVVEQVSIGDRMRIAAMTRELGWEAIQVRPDRHSRSRAYRPTIALLTRTGALGNQAALPPPEPEPSSNACQLPLLIAAEPGTRFLVSIGADGQSSRAQPVPPDCEVMTTRQFLQALIDQNGLSSHPVETPLLFDVIERLQGIIRGRCHHHSH